MFDSGVLHGEMPVASHAYMTQHPRAKNYFVSDYADKWDVFTRDQAIARAQALRHMCSKTIFYVDRGWSMGMKAAKEYCQTHNLPFEERTLNVKTLAQKIPFCSVELSQAIINGENYHQFLQ